MIYRDFIGHGAYVDQGIMKHLHVQLTRWVLEPDNPLTQGVEYFNYGVVERGGNGLFFWKKKGLFAPYLATVTRNPSRKRHTRISRAQRDDQSAGAARN